MRGLLLIIAGMLIGAVAAFVGLGGKSAEVQRLQRGASGKLKELAAATALAQRDKEITNQHAAARGSIQQVLSQIPDQPRLAELIVLLDQALEASGVQLLQVSFSEQPAAGQPAVKTPEAAGALFLQAQVGGNYLQLRAFVRAIESLPRLVVIDRLLVTGSAGGIVAEISMRAFYLR